MSKEATGAISIQAGCAECGNPATGIELWPADVPHPKAGSVRRVDVHIAYTYSALAGDAAGVVIVSGICCSSAFSVDRFDFNRFRELIETGSCRAIHRLDPELVQSYCPACDRNYCREHWDAAVFFDEGLYDYTEGVCPKGHLRTLSRILDN